MKLFQKYLLKTNFHVFIVVLAIMVFMVWLTQSLRFVEFLTSKGAPFLAFLKVSTFLVVQLCYFCIPIAMLVSSMVVITKLLNDRELVILRVAGLNNMEIASPFLKLGSLVMLVNYFISIYLLPVSYHALKETQEYYKNKYVSAFLEEGVFNANLKNKTIYVDKKEENLLNGIFMHDYSNPNKPRTIIAETGSIKFYENGPVFVLENGTHIEEDIINGGHSIVTFDYYKIVPSDGSDAEKVRPKENEEYFINEIFALPMDYKNRSELMANAHQRLSWPLYVVVLQIVMLAIMLNSTFKRSNNYWRQFNISCIAFVLLSTCLISGYLYSKSVLFIYFNYCVICIAISMSIISLRGCRLR